LTNLIFVPYAFTQIIEIRYWVGSL